MCTYMVHSWGWVGGASGPPRAGGRGATRPPRAGPKHHTLHTLLHARVCHPPPSTTSQITRGGTSPRYEFRARLFKCPPLSSAHAWTLTSKRAGEGGSYLKRVLRNSYLGLVPLRVICEVGDGGGWPTSQITRSGTRPPYFPIQSRSKSKQLANENE